MNTAKISSMQLLAVLLICRLFTLMTFVPLAPAEGGFSLQLAAAVISAGIQMLLFIPLILFNGVCPGKTVTYAAAEKNKISGYIISAAYLIFFLSSGADSVVHFIRFLSGRFFRGENEGLMILIFTSVCVYCAYCGIEGLCRSSGAALVFFFITVGIMAAVSRSNFNAENFYIYRSVKNGSGLASAVMDDLTRNSALTAAAFLIRHTDKGLKKGLFGLVAAKLAVSAAIAALITGVLGDYAALTDYPFMEVGSCSGTELFRRNDSLYLILWTVSAVISASLFIHLAAALLSEMFPRIRGGCLISGGAVFALALLLSYGSLAAGVREYVCGGVPAIILTGAVPLVIYLFVKGKKKDEKKA